MRQLLSTIAIAIVLVTCAQPAYTQRLGLGRLGGLPVCTKAELHTLDACQKEQTGFMARITDGNPADSDRCASGFTAGGSEHVTCRYNSIAGDWEEAEPGSGGGGGGATTDAGAVTHVTGTTDDFAVGGTDSSSALFFDESTGDLSINVAGGSIDVQAHATDGSSVSLKEGADDGLNSLSLKVPDFGLSTTVVWESDSDGKFPAGMLVPFNTPLDLDNDGFPDYVRVFGDYDGDASLDQEDIHAAQAALTDSDSQRTIEVVAGIYTTSIADLPTYVANPGNQQEGRHTIFRVASNTTLSCASGVKLVGLGTGGTSSEAWSVIGGDRADGAAGTWHNDNIRIQGCEIDGGMPASYDWIDAAGKQRMGIRIHDCIGCEIENVFVHDTLHTGVLMAGLQSGRVVNLRTNRTGFYGDTAAPENHPAVELSIRPFDTLQGTFDNEYRGIAIERASQGFKGGTGDFLVDDDTDVIENYRNSVRGLYVEDAVTCITVGNVREWLIEEVGCNGAGRGPIKTGTTDWYPNDIAATKDVTVRNYTSWNNETVRSNNSVFYVPEYQLGLVLENVRVITSEPVAGEACVQIDMPTFAEFRGLRTTDCNAVGSGAIRFESNGSTSPGGLTRGPVGFVKINDLYMARCNGSGCLVGADGFENLHVDGITTIDPRAIPMNFQAGEISQNVLVQNFNFNMIPYPDLFQGEGTVAQITAITCDAAAEGIWATATDAQSRTSTTGGGSVRNRLRCESGSWVDWTYTTYVAVDMQSADANSNNIVFKNGVLRGLANSNSDGHRFGIRVNQSTFDGIIIADFTCYAQHEGLDTYAEHCVEGHASMTNSSAYAFDCFGTFGGACETIP